MAFFDNVQYGPDLEDKGWFGKIDAAYNGVKHLLDGLQLKLAEEKSSLLPNVIKKGLNN